MTVNLLLNDIIFFLGVSVFSGVVGSLLGMGGAIFITPYLTLVVGLDIHSSIGIALTALMVNSVSASNYYQKKNLIPYTITSRLQVFCILGVILGFLCKPFLTERWIFLGLSLVLIFSSSLNLIGFLLNHSPKADSFSDDAKNLVPIRYYVSYFIMTIAGAVSSILGIGIGVFKYLVLDKTLKLPLQKSTAASVYLICFVAAPSFTYYLFSKQIHFPMATVGAIGVFVGSKFGARIMPKMPQSFLKILFSLIAFFIAWRMFLRSGVSLF